MREGVAIKQGFTMHEAFSAGYTCKVTTTSSSLYLISYFLRREERSKEASTPSKASPYMGRMQPLRLSLLHLGKLGPSKVPLGFYRLRWTLVDYMSKASLKKGAAWVLSTTLDAGR